MPDLSIESLDQLDRAATAEGTENLIELRTVLVNRALGVEVRALAGFRDFTHGAQVGARSNTDGEDLDALRRGYLQPFA